jgi:hypothetical protein
MYLGMSMDAEIPETHSGLIFDSCYLPSERLHLLGDFVHVLISLAEGGVGLLKLIVQNTHFPRKSGLVFVLDHVSPQLRVLLEKSLYLADIREAHLERGVKFRIF